jgi:hypothetical protein
LKFSGDMAELENARVEATLRGDDYNEAATKLIICPPRPNGTTSDWISRIVNGATGKAPSPVAAIGIENPTSPNSRFTAP